MSLPTTRDARALPVDLVAPGTGVSFGPFSFDPLKLLLGFSIRELVTPLLRATPTSREVNGQRHDVFPLGLPEGEGLAVPVKSLGGEIGFRNMQGVLVVTLPATLANEVTKRLMPSIQQRTVIGPRFLNHEDGSSTAEYAVKWVPGTRFGIPLSGLGEIAFEAARR